MRKTKGRPAPPQNFAGSTGQPLELTVTLGTSSVTLLPEPE
jgi:hypothetical protein